MSATGAWLASAEAVLNRNIQASSEASSLASRLEGSSLDLQLQSITTVRATVHGGHLSLLAPDEKSADARISGSPPALLQLLRSSRPTQGAAASIQGDAEIANLYRQLFLSARPDLEEELSRWVGDLPARKLANLARSVREHARRARHTAYENIAEYLQEEGRDVVNRTELNEYLSGVDAVREATDRLEARLKRLEQRRSRL